MHHTLHPPSFTFTFAFALTFTLACWRSCWDPQCSLTCNHAHTSGAHVPCHWFSCTRWHVQHSLYCICRVTNGVWRSCAYGPALVPRWAHSFDMRCHTCSRARTCTTSACTYTYAYLSSCNHCHCVVQPHTTHITLLTDIFLFTSQHRYADTVAACCIMPYILLSLSAYILLFASQRRYCSCQSANVRSLLYHIISRCIASYRIASHMLISMSSRWRRLGLGINGWCLMLFISYSPLLSCHFISFFYLCIWMWSCHATGGPFWMRSASLANVPLLTVFIWSIEACHRHCPKSFRDEGGYHIVNIVNKLLVIFLSVTV